MSMSFTEALRLLTLAQEKIDEAKSAQRQAGDLIDECKTTVQMVASLGSISGLQEILEMCDGVETECHHGMINRMNEVHQAIEDIKGN